MLRFSVFVWPLRRQAAVVAMFIAVLVFASDASAAILDLQVASGDYNVAGSWMNYTTNTSAVPTTADDAVVRNNGTLNVTALDGGAAAAVIRIGAGAVSGDPAGPLSPPSPYGGGTLNWTGGNITGGANGARLNVGERDNTLGINYTGIVNHSGGKISLNNSTSFLVIGSNGTTPTPTSQYNLSGTGIIGVVAGAGNTNNGINVRNGTFNMTGGSIITDGAGTGQRSMTISSASGTAGSENVATANFSGGIVDVKSGVRMASAGNTKAYMTISGTANIKISGSDFQMGANGTNAYAQVDMSGGSLQVGDFPTDTGTRRLIIGDTALGGTGVFNLSDGTVNLVQSLVVANNVGSKGTLLQTGGTLTVRTVETNRNSGIYDLTTESGAIIINGPTAVFNQADNASGTGQLIIGAYGKGRFEIQQGQANIREIRPSEKADIAGTQTGSRATLNVFGGILRVQDGLNRTDSSAATIPTINLTGGRLEFTPLPAATAIQWQADMNLNGTDFDPRPGGVLQTNLGNATRPANFSLNTGSVWDLNIASNTLIGGADWVAVNNGTASFNGGLINILPVGGYTPAIGDQVRIIGSTGGVTLSALQLSDNNWQASIQESGNALYLTYVPEPSSMLLFGVGLTMFSAIRRTSRK